MNQVIKEIKIERNDIFDYVVGNTTYDPIERCIDPTIYEVFDETIFNNQTKQFVIQDTQYCDFCKQVSLLRSNAKNMNPSEIVKLCEELEEIAPTKILL